MKFIREKWLWLGPLLLALIIILLDQWTKIEAVRYFEGPQGPIEVTPFFNIVMVLNQGISFGFFDNRPILSNVFAAVALIVVIILILNLARLKHRLSSVAFGLLIGGALGNAIDRLRIGAVVDFLDFHAFGWHWPAFNVADSAVVVAVVLLLLQSLVFDKKTRHS